MDSDIISEELSEISKSITTKVPGCEIISCHRNLVSFKIIKTKHKNLTACIQFPNGYPEESLLIEIKSKVLSPTLTNSLSEICDKEAKKYMGKKQYNFIEILVADICSTQHTSIQRVGIDLLGALGSKTDAYIILIAKFLRQFLEDHLLLPCRDEWAFVKKNYLEECDQEKVKQKKGVIDITARQDQYFLKIRTVIPDKYPEEAIELTIEEHSFPGPMAYYFVSQAKEYARQATQPPLRKNPKAPPFQAEPHLKKVMEFLIVKCCKRFPKEHCPLCMEKALPLNPKDIVMKGSDDNYIERMYCGHLFHHGCLDKFMKTPPFGDGKKCPKCSLRIYHDKWNISPQLAENRWAHKQARQRELDEVVDFLS